LQQLSGSSTRKKHARSWQTTAAAIGSVTFRAAAVKAGGSTAVTALLLLLLPPLLLLLLLWLQLSLFLSLQLSAQGCLRSHCCCDCQPAVTTTHKPLTGWGPLEGMHECMWRHMLCHM
jgi:hypothetical protein